MAPQEVPLEESQEHIHHHAEHGGERWFLGVALTAALLAACAAVGALMAEHHANEAILDQAHASDQWSYYQAKSIKQKLAETRAALLAAMGKPTEADVKEKERYAEEEKEIKQEAEHEEKSSQLHMQHHVRLSMSVTIFQVAIAVGAISVLTRRKEFWMLAILAGAVGMCVMAYGIFSP